MNLAAMVPGVAVVILIVRRPLTSEESLRKTGLVVKKQVLKPTEAFKA